MAWKFLRNSLLIVFVAVDFNAMQLLFVVALCFATANGCPPLSLAAAKVVFVCGFELVNCLLLALFCPIYLRAHAFVSVCVLKDAVQ